MKVMLFIACWGAVYGNSGGHRIDRGVLVMVEGECPDRLQEQKLQAFLTEMTPTRIWEHACSLVGLRPALHLKPAVSSLGIAGL
jgi:hypothetical protein